jgi:hypothetical protein
MFDFVSRVYFLVDLMVKQGYFVLELVGNDVNKSYTIFLRDGRRHKFD